MKKSSIIKLLAIIVILLLGYNTSSFSQESEKLFQKGLVKEEGEGSLQEAIDIYNQVFEDASASRYVRAHALLHLGRCYEKLGQEKAKKTYEKLIADFADQVEIVAIGKKELSYLNAGIKVTNNDGLTMRKVWSPAEDTYGVSPDGRYLNYIDWDAITVAVKDLQTGKTWNVSKTGTWDSPSEFPDCSVWSPDSKQIAYYWFIGEGEDRRSELHIVNLDGSGDRVISKSKEDDHTPFPIGWSPDGKHILALNISEGENNPEEIFDQIVLVAVVDGSIHVLESFEGLRSACCGSFSPDNQYIAYALRQEKGSEKNDIFLSAIDGSHKERIVTNPADDRKALWLQDGSGIVFLSDRSGTTDLWTLKLKNGIPQGEPEIALSDFEGTKILGITNDESLYYGKSDLRRHIYNAKLDFNSGEILSDPKKISIVDDERNMKPIWSPDGRYVAYLTISSVSDHIGHRIIFNIHDTETDSYRKLKTDLYGMSNSSMRYFWPWWSPDGKFLLVHGRTEDKLRGFFQVDVETGERTSILVKKIDTGDDTKAIGLNPTLTRNGKDILYLSQDNKTIIKRNIASKSEKKIYSGEGRIGHYRISPDENQIIFGIYPSDNYALYSMPFAGGDIIKLVEFQDKVPIMVSWTPDNQEIIIMTTTSGDMYEILRLPVKGGDPERVLLFEDLTSLGEVRYFDVHPDGQQVVFDIVIDPGYEIWAIENLFKK